VKEETGEMAEGYKEMAAENSLLAAESLLLALEEWSDWGETAYPYNCPRRRKDIEG